MVSNKLAQVLGLYHDPTASKPGTSSNKISNKLVHIQGLYHGPAARGYSDSANFSIFYHLWRAYLVQSPGVSMVVDL